MWLLYNFGGMAQAQALEVLKSTPSCKCWENDRRSPFKLKLAANRRSATSLKTDQWTWNGGSGEEEEQLGETGAMSSLSSSLSHHHYTCHYHISTITSSLSHQHYNISTILVAILVHKCIWGVSASPWFQSQNLKSRPVSGGHLPLITWGSMVNEESMTILVTIVINIPITITLSLSHYQYPCKDLGHWRCDNCWHPRLERWSIFDSDAMPMYFL